MLPNDEARCAGGRFPFARRGDVLAICRDCARRHSFGDDTTPWLDPAPFKHDGERYVCDYRIHAPDGAPDS